jgi:hypothetical protein
MAAIRFDCKTDNKAKHEDIKRRTYFAGGAIVREKITKDTSTAFEGYMEILVEGGTLYREVKELGISTSCNIINN